MVLAIFLIDYISACAQRAQCCDEEKYQRLESRVNWEFFL